ncbi:MAG: DNA alkylation repair protein [Methanobacteriota archaeon]|jgi:3-methyladenine DNA glycosylase AlkD|uniref:DNA alkylation repair protein n=1 Tax=Marine Group III euryarchaeote TaxID=2173149 RepID=A0A7J4GR94_9ARCH|nr:MAG: DNA alkylation repair protein [Euryarchaeota archaeon]HIF37125.1 DNA alkylation repair protein [Marine Group III euryarchaeote]
MKASEEIRKLANKEIAKHSLRFFKTDKGQYGFGDIFLGVRAPKIRLIAKKHIDISIADMKTLIQSKYHEERFLGLIILVNKYAKTKDKKNRNQLYKIYVSSFKYINNWDLVDVTCPHVTGKHLIDKDRTILYKWAKSEDLWTKRIAMVSTFSFIRKNDLEDTFKIAEILLHDEHDLIHKAVGWMLREAGKRDIKKEETFLKKYYKTMPRTMLRYSIEKFPESKRQKYLKGTI